MSKFVNEFGSEGLLGRLVQLFDLGEDRQRLLRVLGVDLDAAHHGGLAGQQADRRQALFAGGREGLHRDQLRVF
jgi:hypothetical protein